jgi:hypothetical protein
MEKRRKNKRKRTSVNYNEAALAASPSSPPAKNRATRKPQAESTEKQDVLETKLAEDDIPQFDDSDDEVILRMTKPVVLESDLDNDSADEYNAVLVEETEGRTGTDRDLSFVQQVEATFGALGVLKTRMPQGDPKETLASILNIFQQPPEGCIRVYKPSEKPGAPFDAITKAKYAQNSHSLATRSKRWEDCIQPVRRSSFC